ncbi:MAG: ribonuclease HII [Gemmatimonadales bacterium]|nr:ribonuclease HII [Gemmatimonadales bacterium]
MSAAGSSLARFDYRKSEGGRLLLAGVDEAGRGSWAGPVVAAAVMLPDRWCPERLDDSKKLSARVREDLCREIISSALCWGACAVSAAVIDRTDILRATLSAMGTSVRKLNPSPQLVLVDGLQKPDLLVPAETVVKGDATSSAIAAASILAKVFRDRIMVAWDRYFPGYGFAAHKGYGAATHQAALREMGPCILHRFSYKPIAELDQGRLF